MNGKAITSMITGILSMLLCWTGFVGVALGIIAIVFFGLVYKAKVKSGLAVTGLVTGIIGVCSGLLWALIYTIIIGAGVME